MFDSSVRLKTTAASTNAVVKETITAELFYRDEVERSPVTVMLRVKPEGPKSIGQALRSIPAEVLEMFNLAEPLPGGPAPVIRPEDIPAGAQPLPKSMSAPYKSAPIISTGARGIWNARD